MLSPDLFEQSSATVQRTSTFHRVRQRLRSHRTQLHECPHRLHRAAPRLSATRPGALLAPPGHAHHRIPQNPPHRLPRDRRQRRCPLDSLHAPVQADTRRSTHASPRIVPASTLTHTDSRAPQRRSDAKDAPSPPPYGRVG